MHSQLPEAIVAIDPPAGSPLDCCTHLRVPVYIVPRLERLRYFIRGRVGSHQDSIHRLSRALVFGRVSALLDRFPCRLLVFAPHPHPVPWIRSCRYYRRLVSSVLPLNPTDI